ncbi:hypothetical protein [Streptomyces sp. NPDC051554]|uniref:hypothetical protein n=1 Tax=Streptomyces sp. NPDC051554 TaxID=3365656 RepID=UPI0037B202AB
MRELAGTPREGGANELMDALRRLAALEREIKAQRALLIAELLAHGGTWQKAADASGVKKQSLHKAYQGEVNELSGICKGVMGGRALRILQLLHPEHVGRLIRKGHLEVEPGRVNGRSRLELRLNDGAIAADADNADRSRTRAVRRPVRLGSGVPSHAVRRVPIPRRP